MTSWLTTIQSAMSDFMSGKSSYRRNARGLNPEASICSDKGLFNAPGSNNCFLNAAVQVLWHIDVFRRSFRSYETHVCVGPSCIFCALKVLLTQFQHSEMPTLPPDVLRQAMAVCYENKQRFKIGCMDDAAECLEKILEQIHFHLTGNETLDTCTEKCCISHQKFALSIVEITICDECGATSEPLSFVQFIHYISSNALVDEAIGQDRPFGSLIKGAGYEKRECPNAECKKVLPLKKILLNCPDVVCIGMIWDSDQPSIDYITKVLNNIGTTMRTIDAFDSYNPKASTVEYKLKAIVAYYGKHYSAYCFHSHINHWVYFDDALVKDLGPDWMSAVKHCIKAHYQPLLLTYINPDGQPISGTVHPPSAVSVPVGGAQEAPSTGVVTGISTAPSSGSNGGPSSAPTTTAAPLQERTPLVPDRESTTNGGGSTNSGGGSTTNRGGNTTNGRESGGGSTTNGRGSTTSGGGSTTSGGGSTTSGGGSTTSAGGNTTSAGGSTTSAGGSTVTWSGVEPASFFTSAPGQPIRPAVQETVKLPQPQHDPGTGKWDPSMERKRPVSHSSTPPLLPGQPMHPQSPSPEHHHPPLPSDRRGEEEYKNLMEFSITPEHVPGAGGRGGGAGMKRGQGEAGRDVGNLDEKWADPVPRATHPAAHPADDLIMFSLASGTTGASSSYAPPRNTSQTQRDRPVPDARQVSTAGLSNTGSSPSLSSNRDNVDSRGGQMWSQHLSSASSHLSTPSSSQLAQPFVPSSTLGHLNTQPFPGAQPMWTSGYPSNGTLPGGYRSHHCLVTGTLPSYHVQPYAPPGTPSSYQNAPSNANALHLHKSGSAHLTWQSAYSGPPPPPPAVPQQYWQPSSQPPYVQPHVPSNGPSSQSELLPQQAGPRRSSQTPQVANYPPPSAATMSKPHMIPSPITPSPITPSPITPSPVIPSPVTPSPVPSSGPVAGPRDTTGVQTSSSSVDTTDNPKSQGVGHSIMKALGLAPQDNGTRGAPPSGQRRMSSSTQLPNKQIDSILIDGLPEETKVAVYDALNKRAQAEALLGCDDVTALLLYKNAATALRKLEQSPVLYNKDKVRMQIAECGRDIQDWLNIVSRHECNVCGQRRELNGKLVCGPCALKEKKESGGTTYV